MTQQNRRRPLDGFQTSTYLTWPCDEPLVHENTFLTCEAENATLPTFEEAKPHLPQPHWPAFQAAVDGYWKAWQLAFNNLRKPTPQNLFVSNFIDTAFNDCIFMWDSSFIVQFGRYGQRAFHFQGTLDDFYARQHPDGFICREIREKDGTDQWESFCPFSTGPNILPWAEWEYFLNHGDVERLKRVFPPLVAFHRWMRANHRWQNGSYWTTGLGCGMDNMPRTPEGYDPARQHAMMSWVDATFQAILGARILAEMGRMIGRPEADEMRQEAHDLALWAQNNLWDDRTGFFYDRHADGSLSGIKQVGAFWSLLAGIPDERRMKRLVAHLNDPKSFNRKHRTPSLAADQQGYDGQTGNYWQGAIWAPTNYMILRGLSHVGEDDLAFEIAKNHHRNVIDIFAQTQTFWENYAPDVATHGTPARPDFVGWTGLPPIAVLIEYMFGLRPIDPVKNHLLWDVRLTDEFGLSHYPLGPTNELNLSCAARAGVHTEPQVVAQATEPTTIEVRWASGSKTLRVGA